MTLSNGVECNGDDRSEREKVENRNAFIPSAQSGKYSSPKIYILKKCLRKERDEVSYSANALSLVKRNNQPKMDFEIGFFPDVKGPACDAIIFWSMFQLKGEKLTSIYTDGEPSAKHSTNNLSSLAGYFSNWLFSHMVFSRIAFILILSYDYFIFKLI